MVPHWVLRFPENLIDSTKIHVKPMRQQIEQTKTYEQKQGNPECVGREYRKEYIVQTSASNEKGKYCSGHIIVLLIIHLQDNLIDNVLRVMPKKIGEEILANLRFRFLHH